MDDDLLELDQDLPCRNCGYNLRGVLAKGQCPECAHPVDDSIERWSEQSNLRPIHEINLEGCGFLITVIVVFLLVFALAMYLTEG